MLAFILPALLLTWGLASLFGNSSDSSEPAGGGEGNDRTTNLGPGDDEFTGNASNDIVNAFGGDDDIFGNRGEDILNLGEGDDAGHGGAGNDIVYGGDGNDFLDGGTNSDRLFGGDGDDFTYLPALGGNPEFIGDENGDDLIRGGAGNDILFDGLGANTIYGDTGDDLVNGVEISAAVTPDLLYGGVGDDLVEGDEGDSLFGGDGTDTFGVFYDVGNDPLHILDYDKDAGEVVLVEFPAGGVSDFSLLEQDGSTFIQVNGSTVAVLDGITGMDPANVSLVNDPDATVPTVNTIFTNGADTYEGGAGNDTIESLAGRDVIRGGAGDDTLELGQGDDQGFGQEGNDIIFGRAGADFIKGGAGNDMLYGGEGNDTVVDDTGTDSLFGGRGDDILDGFINTDSPASGAVLLGGQGADHLTGDALDTLTGGLDVDSFTVVTQGTGATTITDFDSATETLEVHVLTTPADVATPLTYELRATADGLGTEVVVRGGLQDGRVVAVLDGVLPTETVNVTLTAIAA